MKSTDGTVLGGTLAVSLVGGFLLQEDQVFGIVDAEGGRTGVFGNYAEGATILSQAPWALRISYLGNVNDAAVDLAGGTDVVLFVDAIPEPGSVLSLGVVALGLLTRRRRSGVAPQTPQSRRKAGK